MLLENYLKNPNNPNLKLGSIADKGDVYEADIVTKEGSLADKIQVSKDTRIPVGSVPPIEGRRSIRDLILT